MTNTQLYLSIGLPIFTILLTFLVNWRMLANFRAEVERRFEGVEKRFEGVEKRIDHVDLELSAIRQHLMTFYSLTGILQGRVDELSKTGG